jgi:hypothetical protein
MANVEEYIENAENGGYLILILAGIGLVVYIAYEVYELGGSLCTAMCNLLGGLVPDCSSSCSGNSTGNTYSSAANQTLTDPLGSLGSVLGLDQAPSSLDSVSEPTPESGGGG